MGLAGADEMVRGRPLTGGVSSDVYAVSVGDRLFCVKKPLEMLRVSAEWRAPLDRGHREEAWLRFAEPVLARSVPRVLASDPAHHAFAMEFLDPHAFSSWKSQLLEGRADPGVASALGANLAALHQASTASPAAMAQFADQKGFGALRIDPYFGAVLQVHPSLRYEIDQLTAEILAPRAVIHGDVSPKNVLVGAHRVVLLDAECASVGDPAFDLAFCLTHLVLKAVRRPLWSERYMLLARELLSSYCAELPMGEAEDLSSRTTRQMGGLLLARVDGKSPIEYLVNSDREVVRRIGIDILHQPPRTPLDVFDRVSGATP
jgi:5-methylthioribose kinase